MSSEPDTTAQALQLLREGKTLGQVAEATGIDRKRLRALAAGAGITVPKGKPGRPKGSATKAPKAPKAPTEAPAVPSGPELLHAAPGAPLEALAAAHPAGPLLPFPGLPGAPGAAPGASGPSPLPAPPAAPPAPPMSADELLALVTVGKAMVVQNVALIYGVQLDRATEERLTGFNAGEEKALRALAPFAAKYTAGADRYAGPLMAAFFVGVVGLSTFQSARAVKAMAPSKAAKIKTARESATPKTPAGKQVSGGYRPGERPRPRSFGPAEPLMKPKAPDEKVTTDGKAPEGAKS